MAKLILTDVRKHYDRNGRKQVRALDGVSVQVRQGEMIVVEGPSGSGKTTMLLVAGGLLHPTSGRTLIDDVDLYTLSAAERAALRAQKIGFVFQQFHLIPYLNVLDNILAPSLALNADGLEARAHDLLDRFDLKSRSDHLPSELSTGERQRVSLARALLNNPELLLADEPTGNLDHKNAGIVIDCLTSFARDGGAVLMVTHSREAALQGNKIINLHDGTLSDFIDQGQSNE